MPNAGSKKHLKEKNHKIVNVIEYAQGYAKFHGGKETAITKAKALESAARKAVPADTKTANFWANIAGHIGKLAFVLLFFTGCTNYITHPYFSVGDCLQKESDKNLYTGKSLVELLKVTNIGLGTYEFKILRLDRYPALTGQKIIYESISFSYFDENYTKTTCGDVK